MSVSIYTQLHTQAMVDQLVLRAAPKAVRTISSIAEVLAFAKVAQADNDVRSVLRELTITVSPTALTDPYARAAYVPAIRNALRNAPNLTDLTLMLPKTTPAAAFFQVFFEDLSFFKTNLPHGAIRGFLGCNASIRELVVDACHEREGPCPLQATSFARITTLECRAPCIDAIAHEGLTRLLISNDDSSLYIASKIRNLSPMRSLYSLTLDFLTDDFEILDGIALAAPTLRKLKLLEKKARPGRRTSIRRAFNDHLSWNRGLRKLVFLEELALRTSAELVVRPGDHDLEWRLLMGWVQGTRRSSSSTTRRQHPNLFHISIWYGNTVKTSTLTKWFKDGGNWVRLGVPVRGVRYQDVDF